MEPINSSKVAKTHVEETHSQSIILTLPKENGWYSSNEICLYQYQDFWYYASTLEAILSDPHLSRWNHFSTSDILICGYLKCGSTWLKALAFAIATRNHFPETEGSPLLNSLPHDLIPYIEFHNVHGDSAHDPNLHLFATHMPYTYVPESVLDCGCKIIYICRDPKDVFISLWHFIDKIKPIKDSIEPIPIDQAFNLFCDGISTNGPYWDHVLGYWKASMNHPSQVLFLKYEDMMKDSVSHVIRLAKFMGCPFSNEEEIGGVPMKIAEMCSFKSLSNLEVNKSGMKSTMMGSIVNNTRFFRKGTTGDWRNYLNDDMAKKIDQITKQNLSPFGLQL